MMWHFENTGHRPGAFNMQYDIMLAERLMEKDEPPTLRVYGWKPWAISLGYHQHEAGLDRTSLLGAGIDLVQRPTGGRAILHAEELTYSVTMRTNESLSAVYEKINRALVRGLRLLGVNAALESRQPDFPALYRSPSSALCFSSSARCEVKVGGRKLIGSAQRRFLARDGSTVVLQHGSLLLGPAHRRITEFLSSRTDDERERLQDTLRRNTVDLREILAREVTFEEAASALQCGFEMELNVSFDDGGTEVIPVQHMESL